MQLFYLADGLITEPKPSWNIVLIRMAIIAAATVVLWVINWHFVVRVWREYCRPSTADRKTGPT